MMMEINLLPWREKRREQEKKAFVTLLSASAVAALFFVVIAWVYTNHLSDLQINRNQILQQEIDLLNIKIKDIQKLAALRKSLIFRIKIVYDLQKSRPLGVHLFDELVKILPDGVYLTQIERTGNVVTVMGNAESNSAVSVMMKNIEISPWIQSPVLTEIKKISTDDRKDYEGNMFKLSFVLQHIIPVSRNRNHK